MKFQDSSFNGFKVTVGTKSVTHPRMHAHSKSNMPHRLFQIWGHNKNFPNYPLCLTFFLANHIIFGDFAINFKSYSHNFSFCWHLSAIII